ncbi:sugar-binding domain-containing protein [Aquimarina sp. RZ0]|uniref:glycoside hydrolase family 2 protein n=1 Tax=Aquimarina sp. RZ0 TaxID=2607730 RepID=UPI00165EF028|nr:sugar-binding domain-containing protein [Aquimarina sp. RZ0]
MFKNIPLLFVFLCAIAQGQISFVKERNHLQLTEWQFRKGTIHNAFIKDFDSDSWEKVKVPHTYSMDAINEVGYYRGQAWYRSRIDIPESMKGQRIFIRFEAVGHDTKVFVNEKEIGTHIGGYSAFCYEITEAVIAGKETVIAINVTNEPNFKRIPVNDKLFNMYGGIYRPVQIFSTPKVNINPAYYASSGVFVELKDKNESNARIEVRTHISSKNIANKVSKIEYNIFNHDKKLITTVAKDVYLSTRDTLITEYIDIENPVYWNGRKNPYLYTVEIALINDGEKDQIHQSFGLKTFKIDPQKGGYLNDKPYRMYGVCMHQEWKQYGPALKEENHEKDMEMVHEIGVTSLRLSHYQHSDITYQLADEKGILVWAEIPFVHDYSGREGDNAKQQLTELILQNYNHPSIYVWGLWNEVRAYESSEEPCVSLTYELKKIAHDLDTSRLTASASDRGMKSNMGNITDLQAWNKYYGWYYGEYHDMAIWLDESHKKYPDIALGISEYGIGGNIFQQDVAQLEKPSGNYFPEPEQTKYHEITWKIIKDRPFVWSSFVWNMFDFSVGGWNRGGVPNLNHKGLVTYDRVVKKDAFYFYKANWSKNPVLYIAERRNNIRTDGKDISVKIYTNLPEVTLFVNEKEIAKEKLVSDSCIVIFKNIKLIKGENTIRITSNHQNKTYVDKVVLKH